MIKKPEVCRAEPGVGETSPSLRVDGRESIMKKSTVSIVRTPRKPDEKEIDASVRKAIELAGGLPDVISRGRTVLIKPNLVEVLHPDTGATTDPRVCRSIAKLVKEAGARPVIAESSSVGVDTEKAYQVAGYTGLRDEGFEVIDLKKEETVKVSVPEGKVLKEVPLPRIAVEAAAIISVPRLKTHAQTTVTLALKNMKGLLTDTFKRRFHIDFGLYEGIADLSTVVKPSLSVVDGIIGQEGLGPISGIPVEMDLIIAGRDPVAVDAVASVVMGFAPRESGVTDAVAKRGIGTARLEEIEIAGEPIVDVQRRFKRSEEGVYELITIPRDFQLLIGERACTGCRNCVLSALVEMETRGHLEKAGGWTIVAGKVDKFPEKVDRERLLLVGNCTARYRKRGTFVRGCTPNDRDVVGAILGEELQPLSPAAQPGG